MSEYSKNEISVQNENGTTIFSMQEIRTYPVNAIEISDDIEQKITSMISPILSNAPNIAKNIHSIRSYEAVFSPQMKEFLKKGVATIHKDKQGELLPQIIHTGMDGKKGQIIKKVRLKSGITSANLALLGWQIASMITAQKHLMDINNKLESISKEVQNIQEFLEQELFSQIESRICATKNLMTCISKSNDFFQEFKDFHAGQMSSNLEKTDELIRRIDKILDSKLIAFSKEVFKEESMEKAVTKFNDKIQEIIALINTYLQLIQTQHILCMIYAFYAENNTYAETWKKDLNNHQNNLKNKVKNFEGLVIEKNESIDYYLPFWEKCLAAIVMPTIGVPMVIGNEILAKFDMTDSIFDGETETDKARRIQKQENSKIFTNLKHTINLLFNNIEQQTNSINTEHKVIIDVTDGKIKNVKLLS